MIEALDEIYHRIADAVVEQLPEVWKSAKVDAVFFSDSSDYFGEYVSSSGRSVDFEINMDITRVFKELRRIFKQSGKPMWGQASFEILPNGKFNMHWRYDDCDEQGNTIWDEQEWHRRQEERRLRLTSN